MKRMRDNTPARRPFWYTSSGFSLLEIIIVMAVLSLFIAFAGPRVAKSLSGLTLKTTSKKIAGVLRYARSQAAGTGWLFNVIFDTEKKIVYVVKTRPPSSKSLYDDNETEDEPEEGDDEDDRPQGDSAQAEIRSYPLPENILISKVVIGATESSAEEGEGIYQLTFFPNGTSQGADIVLADEKERSYNIHVDFMSGVVSLAEQTDE